MRWNGGKCVQHNVLNGLDVAHTDAWQGGTALPVCLPGPYIVLCIMTYD